ncbi:MAG: amino acid adenylation domain-containing protein, partial [bacterium]|nr:amino acid adenylation domain-containing protein [bacterium]
PPAAGEEPVRWLVVLGGESLGQDLAARLGEEGQEVVTVSPGKAFHRHGRHAFTLDPESREHRGRLLRELLGKGEPLHQRPQLERPYQAPRDDLELAISRFLEELLGIAEVGVDDDFFELGGDSLLATQVVSRLRDAFGVEISLEDFLEGRTVAGLARQIAPREPMVHTPIRRLEDHERDAVPLSFAQQRLWFLAQLEPEAAIYNLPLSLRLRGPLHRAALEAAIHEIVRRHQALRTRFAARSDGERGEVICEPPRLTLPVVDLAALRSGEGSPELRRLAREDARRPFDLARAPLVRAALLRAHHNDHLLLLNMHHAASDGWSIGVFSRELEVLYEAFSTGRAGSTLPELEIQYADFAAWQRQWLQGEALEAQLAYWRDQLAGIPGALELPTDRPRPLVLTYRGALYHATLPRPLTESLKVLSRRRESTLFMTLLAAFKAMLHRTTGQDDLCVGSPVANRNRSEIEPLIGFFVNTLLLRTDLGGNPVFGELLDRVRAVALGAYTHQDLPFEKLVEELQPERDLSRQPLFQVMFALQNFQAPTPELAGLTLSAPEPDTGMAMFDLTFFLNENEGALEGWLEYATDLFDTTTIRRFVRHFRTLLEGVVADSEQRLSEVALLSAAESRQLALEWNDTRVAYPAEASIHQLFEARTAATPEAVAVVFAEQQVSYRELNRRANRLAHFLRAQGVGPETRVALCIERSLEMVVGILGILKAGGAYVPLDPSYPSERLALMLGDAGISVLLLDARFSERLAILPELRLFCLRSDQPAISRHSEENPSSTAAAESLAYVMFTSGSTGLPKGICVVHRAVVRLVRGADYARLDDREVFLQLAPISFDASTLEIWAALLNGGRLVVFPPHTPSLQELGKAVEGHRVTTLWLTAGLFHQMGDETLTGLGAVRQLLAGGDVLSAGHVRKVLEKLPGCILINGYGPTENTTFTCCSPMREPGEVGDPVSIGRPISSTRGYVLDRQLQPLGVGIPGELTTGGDGLARGYLNRPQLTAASFVPSPFGETPGARLYRTGDVVRLLPDGRIEFMGRRDYQVKVRGFRIELGEVEAALGRHPGVREAVVMVRGNGARRLVAYAVRGEDGEDAAELDGGELRVHLGESLPDYMVPAVFVFLDALPLTPNGKVDRAALGRRELPASELTGEPSSPFAGPGGPLEEILVAIWTEVLGATGRVGVHDDFFALGGHSLLATQVVSRVAKTLRVEVPVRALFEHSTVAALARYLSAALRRDEAPAPPPLRPAARTGPPPLSFAQERLWFFDRFAPGSALYNVPIVLRLSGRLDPAALERALSEIVRRHEVLRTTFETVDGKPVQVIRSDVGLPLPVVDLAGLADPQRRREADRLVRAEARESFDLVRGPVVRTTGLRFGALEHALLLTVHHIAFDGWSIGVFLRELKALYGAFATGSGRGLPELGLQYADFTHWQRYWLTGEVLESRLGYWREQLAELPVLELPTDRPRPALQSFRGAVESFRLPAELGRPLTELSRRSGTTLFMTLLAAFQTLLGRISGQLDLAVGTAVANRNRTEIEGLLGFFVNTLVLRTELRGNPSFQELLTRVREVTLEAYAHQDLPFEKLVEELAPERDLSHNPLVQVHFVLQNAPVAIRELAPGLGAKLGSGTLGQAKFDLLMALEEEEDGGLSSDLEYRSDLFDAPTIRRMVGHFRNLLAGAVASPAARLPQLPLLAAAERHQLVHEWSHTPHDAPGDLRPDELLAAQAARRGDAIAVVSPAGRLSYGELWARADRLASHLRSLGVGPEVLVGLFFERSAEALVGILGVLRAGGAYLPLDPAYPRERLAFMLEDSGVPVVLTREGLAAQLPPHRATVVRLDADRPALAGVSP